MDSPAIGMSSVSCVFGAQKVLWNLDLNISTGETVAIVGESGCGKSVTMKVMMQLLHLTSDERPVRTNLNHPMSDEATAS